MPHFDFYMLKRSVWLLCERRLWVRGCFGGTDERGAILGVQVSAAAWPGVEVVGSGQMCFVGT